MEIVTKIIPLLNEWFAQIEHNFWSWGVSGRRV